MANYYSKTRTNYFGVTDEDKFKEIMSKIRPTPEYVQETVDGRKKFTFYCDGSLDGYPGFSKDLQEILEEGDAVLITEVGSENFRYLTGYCTIITRTDVTTVDLAEYAKNTARQLLGNPEWDTRNEY